MLLTASSLKKLKQALLRSKHSSSNMDAEKETIVLFDKAMECLKVLRQEHNAWMEAKDAANDAINPIHAILMGGYNLEVNDNIVRFDFEIGGRSVSAEYDLKSVTFDDGDPPPEAPPAFPEDKLRMLEKMEQAMIELKRC